MDLLQSLGSQRTAVRNTDDDCHQSDICKLMCLVERNWWERYVKGISVIFLVSKKCWIVLFLLINILYSSYCSFISLLYSWEKIQEETYKNYRHVEPHHHRVSLSNLDATLGVNVKTRISYVLWDNQKLCNFSKYFGIILTVSWLNKVNTRNLYV